MPKKITIGGQAVIEGVMIKSADKYAVSVRRSDNKIITKVFPAKKYKSIFANLPLIRGCLRFVDTLVMGIKSISYSASQATEKEEKLSSADVVFTIMLSFAVTILLFYAVPLLVARIITPNSDMLFSVIDGLVRILILLCYLLLISLIPDIRRMFQYHGAEHMTVHCYERGKKLTIKNIRKYETMHPRCGTNFILIVFFLSIFIFTLLPPMSLLERFGARLLLLPLVAGIAYELLKLGGRYPENPLLKILMFPGMMLQKITTRNPDDDMIKVAVKALNAAVSSK